MTPILILIVCLASSPTECHEEHPPLEAPSATACLMQGEAIGAQWIADHPKWTLTGWKCQFGQKEEHT
jgi:hypothetical protein